MKMIQKSPLNKLFFGILIFAFFFFISCENPTDENSNHDNTFTAVSGISNVPTAATAGTPLSLSGTVSPSNATNKSIVWSLSENDNGSTEASIINGNTLNTKTAGTATVVAIISNGAAQGTDYTHEFAITVNSGS